jgi:hypothetical protein
MLHATSWLQVSGAGDFPAAKKVVHGAMLPSGYVKIAIENGHRNSEFSH